MHKVHRYLEKRKNRKWVKKISYTCRKSVADKRLRIKGRFVKSSDQMNIMERVTGAANLAENQSAHLSQSDEENCE